MRWDATGFRGQCYRLCEITAAMRDDTFPRMVFWKTHDCIERATHFESPNSLKILAFKE